MARKPHEQHWYHVAFGECPVCGRPKEYRTRRYDPMPENPEERFEQLSDAECYDYCIER